MRRKSRMARLKPPRARFHEFSAENDIRYRGLLTYQHFQFLGWLCIAAVQAAFLMRVCGKADPAYAAENGWLQEMLESMGSMSLPLLLIANFAQILDDSNGYRKQLLKNVAASLLICGLSSLLFYRYLAGAMARIRLDPAAATPALEKFARTLSPTRFEAYNIFIDLLMCSLVMFFLNYRPKRVLRPWARLLFRLLALLPVAYEVGCMMLKVMSSRQLIDLPFWAFSLLPVKPPMTFVLFLILAVFIKTRELRFRRHGKTHEDYQAFLRTNRNAHNFSFFLAAMILWYILSILPATSRCFPNVVETMRQLPIMIQRGVLWKDISSSMISVFSGFGLGLVIALPVAILMAWYKPVRNIIEPWIEFIRNIPPLAYVPLVVIAAGVGRKPQIIVITLATFLTMCITIYQGVINIDETLIKAARVLGATDKDIFIRVIADHDGLRNIQAVTLHHCTEEFFLRLAKPFIG